MGWGFVIIVDKTDKETAIDALETAGAQAEHIGNVTEKQKIEINYNSRQIVLQ
jgi:phosphoribosylaminoimidazole (AIR) synthetase